MTRRGFLRTLFWSTAALGAGVGAYSALVEPRRVEVTRLRVPIRNLPRAFDGLTIAQLSDLHRSRFVSAAYLDHCVELANALRPDLMLFTGDYLTHGRHTSRRGQTVYGDDSLAEGLARDSARCLGRARARHGVFACLGNHDHWYDAAAVTQAIRDAGVPVLRNQNTAVSIHGEVLPVVGLGDLWTEGADLRRAFAGVDAPFAVVLMHNPDLFAQWPQPGAHLVFAGHTHGGQVSLPLFGPPLVPSQYGRRFARGLFRRGDTLMYVNRGLGLIAPPVRFNCRPEITCARLERS